MVIAAKTRRPTPNPSFRPQSSGGWRDGTAITAFLQHFLTLFKTI
jgi:hypothetical protein